MKDLPNRSAVSFRKYGDLSYSHFETYILGLAVPEENPGLYATAHGMLDDSVRTLT